MIHHKHTKAVGKWKLNHTDWSCIRNELHYTRIMEATVHSDMNWTWMVNICKMYSTQEKKALGFTGFIKTQNITLKTTNHQLRWCNVAFELKIQTLTSVHYFILFRVAGVSEPVTAVTGREADYTLDRLPVWGKHWRWKSKTETGTWASSPVNHILSFSKWLFWTSGGKKACNEYIHLCSQMLDEAEMSRMCCFNVCNMNMGKCKSDS